MEITPRELRDTEIAEAFRGYNRDVVNDMLERAAAALEQAEARVRQASDQLNNAQAEAGRTRETEDILHKTLLLAQRAADEAVAEAQEKAREIKAEAEAAARKVRADAETEARSFVADERERLEAEIVELAAKREALLADVEAMTRFEAEYRDRMVRALEADLVALRTRPQAAPGARPQISDVEVPPSAPTPAAAKPAPAPPAPSAPPTAATPPPIHAAAPTPPAPKPSPAPGASVPGASVPGASSAPPIDSLQRRDAAANEPVQSTAAVDVRAILDQQLAPSPPATPAPSAPPAPPAAPAAPAASAPEPPVAEPPAREQSSIDLDDGVDAEVLDDDAFFATLREAVHDDSPLGPRDEAAMSFFDEEDADDRGSFFRRRR